MNDGGHDDRSSSSRTRRSRCALAKHAYVLETGRVVLGGVAADLQANESVRRSHLWLTSGARWLNFIQQVVSGLASGGIYGSLALALVLIHRSTGVLNFAQGELATLSAFICWSLMDHGWSFWPAFGVTIALSFVGGALIQQITHPADPGRPRCSAS